MRVYAGSGLVLQRRITGGLLERARSQSRRAPSLGWRRCRDGKRSASRRRVWPRLWKYGVGDCTRTQHELGGPAVAPLPLRERCHLPPRAREAGNCTWAVVVVRQRVRVPCWFDAHSLVSGKLKRQVVGRDWRIRLEASVSRLGSSSHWHHLLVLSIKHPVRGEF